MGVPYKASDAQIQLPSATPQPQSCMPAPPLLSPTILFTSSHSPSRSGRQRQTSLPSVEAASQVPSRFHSTRHTGALCSSTATRSTCWARVGEDYSGAVVCTSQATSELSAAHQAPLACHTPSALLVPGAHEQPQAWPNFCRCQPQVLPASLPAQRCRTCIASAGPCKLQMITRCPAATATSSTGRPSVGAQATDRMGLPW